MFSGEDRVHEIETKGRMMQENGLLDSDTTETPRKWIGEGTKVTDGSSPTFSSPAHEEDEDDGVEFMEEEVIRNEIKATELSTSLSSGSSTSSASSEPPTTKLPSSDKSALILIPEIATSDARSRNYLLGCANSWGSLLGGGQLDMHLPNRTLSVLVATFNTNEWTAQMDSNLEELLLPSCIQHLPHVYAVGTQENTCPRQDWEVLLQETIGLSHVLLHSACLGTLHLAVFVRRELLWFCSEPREVLIATRPGTVVKTKGAVAVAFKLFGTSILLINCHLTAHDDNVGDRIADHLKIKEGLKGLGVPEGRKKKSLDPTSKYDCTFWFGDLNFRILVPRGEVLSHLCSGSELALEALLAADQLNNKMRNGHAFNGFREEKIRFAPTYKYDVGTDAFDTSEKQRTPAYTDRILYRVNKKGSVECDQYSSVLSVRISDHKPVFGVFRIQLRPGRDDIPLAAGLFNRNVYLKALARRKAMQDPLLREKASRFCSVM